MPQIPEHHRPDRSIHDFIYTASQWCEHYRKWAESGRGTNEMKKAHQILDRFTQELVDLFGDHPELRSK